MPSIGGNRVSLRYRARLHAAAVFCAAYTRSDGEAPLRGDADDARALPLGSGSITDHRHLVACTAVFLQDRQLAALACGGWDEALWLYGAAGSSPHRRRRRRPPCRPLRTGACSFCGHPGRRCLSIVDASGLPAGVATATTTSCHSRLPWRACPYFRGRLLRYTASFEERNYFRSTQAHNTPQIDGEEINRFVSPQLLWLLHEDASHWPRAYPRRPARGGVQGGHSGYRRLAQP